MAAHRKEKRAKGGSVNVYNAKGSPEMKEADDRKAGFKRGGAMKDGGCADGMKGKKRLDKRARGGPTGRAMGRGSSPYSTASRLSNPSDKAEKAGGDTGRDP